MTGALGLPFLFGRRKKMDNKMKKVTGLWLKKSSHGKSYMTAPLDREKIEEALRSVRNGRLLLFKNTYKKEEEQPDYILYVGEEMPHRNSKNNKSNKNSKNNRSYEEAPRTNSRDDWDRNQGDRNIFDDDRGGSSRGRGNNRNTYDRDDDSFFR